MKVRIQRRFPYIPAVRVAAGGVRLPDLHEGATQRLALRVAHRAVDDDPLTDRHLVALDGEVIVVRPKDPRRAQLWAGDLGDRLGQVDQRLLGVAQPGRLVVLVVKRRVHVRPLA